MKKLFKIYRNQITKANKWLDQMDHARGLLFLGTSMLLGPKGLFWGLLGYGLYKPKLDEIAVVNDAIHEDQCLLDLEKADKQNYKLSIFCFASSMSLLGIMTINNSFSFAKADMVATSAVLSSMERSVSSSTASSRYSCLPNYWWRGRECEAYITAFRLGNTSNVILYGNESDYTKSANPTKGGWKVHDGKNGYSYFVPTLGATESSSSSLAPRP